MTTTNFPVKLDYGSAILSAFEYLLSNYPEVFVIGQGLWSPWYVGNSMTDLDKKFGECRVIDTPVSEAACTGAATGASLTGMKPIVVHPRIEEDKGRVGIESGFHRLMNMILKLDAVIPSGIYTEKG